MKKLIYFIIILVLLVLYVKLLNEDDIVSKIKSGKAELVCNINNEEKIIDPKKIVGFDDESGYFYFINGYAKNCVVYKKGE